MAHTRHGTHGRAAYRPDRLATLARIDARDQEVRVPLSHSLNVGPGCRAVRRVAIHLRNAGFLFSCLAHRGTPKHRNGCLSDRACAAVDSATTNLAHRDARGDSERRSEE